jgi:hypothetical protein
MITTPQFRVDPLLYVTGDERPLAVLSLQAYFESFTGRWFETLADPDPFSITASDLVAVSMLGVTVPANAAAWLLGEGRPLVSDLLRQIPVDRPIWDLAVDLSPQGAAWHLWNAVGAGQWPPERKEKSGMGRTKTSKLLATKRPQLLPVWDSVVAAALLGPNPTSRQWWALWRARLQDRDGEELQDQVRFLVKEVPGAGRLSILRVLDVVVWMREQGYKTVKSLKRDFSPIPSPASRYRTPT